MKKIVFFILLLMIIPNQVYGNPIIQECNNGEVEIDYKSSKGAVVVKRGSDPFLTQLENENGSYYIKGVFCENDTYVLYGYGHFHDSSTFYDELVIVLDSKGEQIAILRGEKGELEEVVDVLWFDNIYVVITEQHTYTEDPEFMNTYVSFYDNDFNLIDEHLFMEEFSNQFIKDSLLIINYDYDNQFDVGIRSNGEHIYNEQIFELETDYYYEIYLPYINKAYINNEVFINGVNLNYPGIYDIKYNNQLYTFNLHPIVTGVLDNEVYDTDVFINVSSGNTKLNGELYVNDTRISDPGNYILEVTGVNGYIKTIEFTIKANVNGVINGHTYYDDLLINFTGTGYLNGNQVSTPLIIDKTGEYIFRVIGENGYSEEYNFSLSEDKNFDLVDFIQKIDVYLIVGVIITGIIVIKKSK